MQGSKLSPMRLPLNKMVSASGDLKSPGIFVLFTANVGSPNFVGRAEASLFEALMAYRTHPSYKYYKVLPCKTRAEAYMWECIYWHSSGETLDNGVAKGGKHPEPPAGLTNPCPVPGCTHEPHFRPLPESHNYSAGGGVSY